MQKVFITGMGAISSIGSTIDEHLNALRSGKCGIQKARFFQSRYTENLVFGEVPFSDDQLKEINNVAHQHEFTRTTVLAINAFKEAIKEAKISSELLKSDRTAFISSSTVGGMYYTDKLYSDANLKGIPSNYVRSYEGSDHTFRITKMFEIGGIIDTINTACSSSANAILLGARLIQTGRADRVIVGGADSIAKYTVNGFNSLMILSDEACQPFNENRSGLSLGEGAAYLVIESEDSACNKMKIAELIGFGNSNDAFHPSTTSENAIGPILSMERALKMTAIKPDLIDYINAHGTGTVNNDITETYALNTVFTKVPPYNSTKSYTGHTLAASGSLEAILSLLSLKNNELYPSLRCETPIKIHGSKPISKFEKKELKNVMSNSFGFGGNCTSLIFSKCI